MRLTRAVLLASMLGASASWAQDARMVPVTIDGQTVRLETRMYQPATAGPAPTLVFNHGSTGRGTDPRSFTRPIDYPEVAQVFVERGWAVVMPARRGRGGSEGQYDEGFAPNRSLGYACDLAFSLPGAEHALRDIEAAMGAILALPFVDPTRVVIAGQSRGGILSVAYAGQHPAQVKGVINFVGGWVGAGCDRATGINQKLFARGVRYLGEMLWLYGDDDSFYPLSHSRETFAAFQSAGGMGTFHALPAGAGGHYIWRQPNGWVAFVDAYLKRQGLPSQKP